MDCQCVRRSFDGFHHVRIVEENPLGAALLEYHTVTLRLVWMRGGQNSSATLIAVNGTGWIG